MSSPWTCGLGPLRVGSWAASQAHTLTQHTTSAHSLNLRNMVSPQKVVTSGLWEVINLPFCLLKQAWIQTWVLTSLTSGASLPTLVPVPHWVLLCIRGLHPNSLGRWIPPPDQGVCWRLVGSSPGSPGDAPRQQGRWQITVSAILDDPQEMLRKSLVELQDTEFSRKQCFIVPAQT
jgi:hypothetical protein